MLASTWNPELSYKQGRMMGNLGLLKNINVFWGSSVQTHRSPFGGRLYEYTSEDAILGGYISAGQVKGLVSKGISLTSSTSPSMTRRPTETDATSWLGYPSRPSARTTIR